MMKSFWFFIFFSVLLMGKPESSIASDSFSTYTHTNALELKPASLLGSYKTAAVCFMGYGGCDTNIGFGKGDDYSRNPEQMCHEEGFLKTSCTIPEYLYNQCPYDGRFYKECRRDNAKACIDSGYSQACGLGYVPDNSQTCPYDSSYKKCKCDPCSGFDYTYGQATAEGYMAGASCDSCGTTKYKRSNASCSGFLTCNCGGEIGSPSCKSGTNTLYKTCKSCCTDTCPSGYYKEAGNRQSITADGSIKRACSYGTLSQNTECGATCYKCTPPETGSYCWQNKCAEGFTEDTITHDYSCKPGTCKDKINARYSNYFFGGNFDCKDNSNDYKFDRPYVGEGRYAIFPSRFCYLSPSVITQSFYSESDFFPEFPECQNYCPPIFDIKNKTFKGNISLGIDNPSSGVFTNITVDGILTLPGQVSKKFDTLTLTANSSLKLYTRDKTSLASLQPASLKNVTLYPGTTIESFDYLSTIYDVIIAGNTASTPITLTNMDFEGTLTSSHILSGTSGGIYLNISLQSGEMTNCTINRNLGGKINITYLQASYDRNRSLFKNPKTDTVVTLTRNLGSYTASNCITLANDASRKLCSAFQGNAVITFLTDDSSSQVMPSCCSLDSGCAASSWNNGTVKCEGYSKK